MVNLNLPTPQKVNSPFMSVFLTAALMTSQIIVKIDLLVTKTFCCKTDRNNAVVVAYLRCKFLFMCNTIMKLIYG